jgi:hypothetical protein
MKIYDAFVAGVFLIRLSLSLLALWATLGWKVHRARRAFEQQLMRQGMARNDARRISAGFSKLKNEMMSTLKGSAFKIR